MPNNNPYEKIASKASLLIGLIVLLIVLSSFLGEYAAIGVVPIMIIIFILFFIFILKNAVPLNKINEIKEKLEQAKQQGKSKEDIQSIIKQVLSRPSNSTTPPAPTPEGLSPMDQGIKDEDKIGLKLVFFIGTLLLVGLISFIYFNRELVINYGYKLLENLMN